MLQRTTDERSTAFRARINMLQRNFKISITLNSYFNLCQDSDFFLSMTFFYLSPYRTISCLRRVWMPAFFYLIRRRHSVCSLRKYSQRGGKTKVEKKRPVNSPHSSGVLLAGLELGSLQRVRGDAALAPKAVVKTFALLLILATSDSEFFQNHYERAPVGKSGLQKIGSHKRGKQKPPGRSQTEQQARENDYSRHSADYSLYCHSISLPFWIFFSMILLVVFARNTCQRRQSTTALTRAYYTR